MSQTMHDLIRSALIEEAINKDNFHGCFEDALENFMTPEKYKRMWKKITGKTITLQEARRIVNKKSY